MAEYVPRLADAALAQIVASLPALLLVGPRATGKTTTARRFAAGAVLHTGPGRFMLSERIMALPIGAIWGPR